MQWRTKYLRIWTRISMDAQPLTLVAVAMVGLVCIIVLGMTRKLAVTAPVKRLKTE